MLLTEWCEQYSQAQQKRMGKKYIKLLKALSLYLLSRLSVVISVAISNQCLCVLLLNFSNRNQYRLLLK